MEKQDSPESGGALKAGSLTETLNYLEGEIDVTEKKAEAKKKQRYKQKECPYCHKMVGNLGNHVQLAHPGEAPKPPEPTKDDLLSSAPMGPKTREISPPVYYCQDCKAELRKGESSCWKCGQVLNWEGIE